MKNNKNNIQQIIPMKTKTPLLKTVIALCIGFTLIVTPGNAAETAPISVVSAKSSSSSGPYKPNMAIDGVKDDPASRWVSGANGLPAWIELGFNGEQQIGGVHLYSGFNHAHPIENFVFQYWSNGQWKDIPSGKIDANQETALAIVFDPATPIQTQRLRLLVTASPVDLARVSEIVVWPAGPVPPIKN